MKYLKQICLITAFSFLGELCRFLIPWPIPASLYGMALLFAALSLKLISVDSVKASGSFLTSFLPVLFVAPAVSLMECWAQMRRDLLPLALIIVVSTVLTFGISGTVTQRITKKGKKNHD